MHAQESERRRQSRYRDMQRVFDTRREDLEMRMQEMQLESELRFMEQNPGRAPTWAAIEMKKFSILRHRTTKASSQESMALGVSFEEEKAERGADGKFKKKDA